MEVRYHPENCNCLECRIGRVTAERDRYRAALEEIGKTDAPIKQGWAWEYIKIARKALNH